MTKQDQILPAYGSYVGSKSGFGSHLLPRMPDLANYSYVEVFAGMAGLFLVKPKARLNILNDIDPDVVETHTTVAGDASGVMAEMKKLRPSRRTFIRLRDMRGTTEWYAQSPTARAAAFIFIMRCSVNGCLRSFSVSAKARSNFHPDFDLTPYAAKFDGVTFENLHWRELLNRFVFKPKQVSLFCYLDPPYVTADTEKYYGFNFDPLEHIMLARTLAQINALNDGDQRNAKVMVSYDDDPDGFIRSLYRAEFGWRIETIDVRYASEHRANRCRNELVIMNYDPPTNGDEGAVACGDGPTSAADPQSAAAQPVQQ